MVEMYSAMAGSPITYLAGDISAAQTTISVGDDTKLPPAPNLCTIGYGENIETIRYGAKSNGVLQDVTRGIEGTPRAWQSGTEVARFYTAYEHNRIIDNIEAIHQAHLTHLAEMATDDVHGLNWEEYKELTLLNGWTGVLRYRKNGMGLVWIYGEITPGVTERGTTIATIPDGYMPPHVTALPAQSRAVSVGGIVGLAITTSGNINIYGAAGDNLGNAVRINYVYKAA